VSGISLKSFHFSYFAGRLLLLTITAAVLSQMKQTVFSAGVSHLADSSTNLKKNYLHKRNIKILLEVLNILEK
jgi:hypothetical protein